MSESAPTEGRIERLVRGMAILAIVATALGILFPRFPASLSLAVDTLLLLCIAGIADHEARNKGRARPAGEG